MLPKKSTFRSPAHAKLPKEKRWWANKERAVLAPPTPPWLSRNKPFAILPAMTLYAKDLTWARDGSLSFSTEASKLIMSNGSFPHKVEGFHNKPHGRMTRKYLVKTIDAHQKAVAAAEKRHQGILEKEARKAAEKRAEEEEAAKKLEEERMTMLKESLERQAKEEKEKEAKVAAEEAFVAACQIPLSGDLSSPWDSIFEMQEPKLVELFTLDSIVASFQSLTLGTSSLESAVTGNQSPGLVEKSSQESMVADNQTPKREETSSQEPVDNCNAQSPIVDNTAQKQVVDTTAQSSAAVPTADTQSPSADATAQNPAVDTSAKNSPGAKRPSGAIGQKPATNANAQRKPSNASAKKRKAKKKRKLAEYPTTPISLVTSLRFSQRKRYVLGQDIIIRLPECIVDCSELVWEASELEWDKAKLSIDTRLGEALMECAEVRMDLNAYPLRQRKYLQTMQECLTILDKGGNIDIAANLVKNGRYCLPVAMFKDSEKIMEQRRDSLVEKDVLDPVAKRKIELGRGLTEEERIELHLKLREDEMFDYEVTEKTERIHSQDGWHFISTDFFLDGLDIPHKDFLWQASHRPEPNKKLVCHCGGLLKQPDYLPFKYSTPSSPWLIKFFRKLLNKRKSEKLEDDILTGMSTHPNHCSASLSGMKCQLPPTTSPLTLANAGLYMHTVPRVDLIEWDPETQRLPPAGWRCTRYTPCSNCFFAQRASKIWKWREDFLDEYSDVRCHMFPDGCKKFGPNPKDEDRTNFEFVEFEKDRIATEWFDKEAMNLYAPLNAHIRRRAHADMSGPSDELFLRLRRNEKYCHHH